MNSRISRRSTCEGVMSWEWQKASNASLRSGSMRTVSLAVLGSMQGVGTGSDVKPILISYPAAANPAATLNLHHMRLALHGRATLLLLALRARAQRAFTVRHAVAFEVVADQATDHLGCGHILGIAQLLERALLLRVDEDGEPGLLVFHVVLDCISMHALCASDGCAKARHG